MEAESASNAFESDLKELEELVRQLESGDLPLEQAISLYEKASALSETCRKRLEEAETRIEILVRKGNSVTPQPFEENH
jgi:exodeoxyribonuclease VII small subunit